MEERRKVPRHQVGEEFANLPANMSVRVLDISTAGVLLQSPRFSVLPPWGLPAARLLKHGAAVWDDGRANVGLSANGATARLRCYDTRGDLTSAPEMDLRVSSSIPRNRQE